MSVPVNANRQAVADMIVATCQMSFSAAEAMQKTLAQLEIDSLELMQLSIEMEDRFGLRINIGKITAATTLVELIDDAAVAAD